MYSLYDDCVFDIHSACFYFNNTYKKDIQIQQNMKDMLIKKRHDILFSQNKIITTLNLIPTMRCDGLCSYCYNRDNNNQTASYMTVNILKQTITNISKTKEVDLNQIRIYGGEPFLNPYLKDIILYLHTIYPNISFYISSGLLYSDKIFKQVVMDCIELKNYGVNFYIGVSVDFGTTVDTFTRVNKYNLTQQDILDRTNILYEQGISVRYATVVTKNTDLNILKEDIINHCNKYYKESDMIMDSSKVQYAHRISIASDNELYPSLDQVDNLYRTIKDLYTEYPVTSNLFPYTDVVKSASVLKITDDIFMLAYEPFYCGIYTDMLTIREDGSIVNCHMHPFEYKEMTEELYLSLFKDKDCMDCDMFLMCRGACPNRKLYAIKSKESYCLWIKYSYILGLERMKKIYKTSALLKNMLNNENNIIL